MFKVRTQKPTTWNKLYNNYHKGGLSQCIDGNPTDPISNVLANCVGYACSRFNEVYNELTGFDGMKYTALNCNAEDFWQRAKTLGLSEGQIPRAGAIMVWEGAGSLAGHVAFVERVINPQQVYTSESGYQCAAFWNAYRSKGNGNWGAGDSYRFLGFIYNPAVKEYAWKKEWHLYLDGKEVTGWAKVEGKWYFMDANGAMQTGWLANAGKWYLLGEDGAMLKGWQKVRDHWYYLQPTADANHKEGEMRTGWIKDPKYNAWFFLSNNGDMLTGWQKAKDKWYYLNPTKTDKFALGQMWTGWLKYKEKWYYLDPTDGYMYTGTHTIDGKSYTFDSSGALV